MLIKDKVTEASCTLLGWINLNWNAQSERQKIIFLSLEKRPEDETFI